MNFKIALILMIWLIYHGPLSAQYYNQQESFLKANSIWAFGQQIGLDFNTGTPTYLPISISAVESSASVSDSTGNLLFYFDGSNVLKNRNQSVMQNGNGLIPEAYSSPQGVIIVPVIDTPWKYYVFTKMHAERFLNGPPAPSLSYSVVDMTLDNGLGGIESGRKNIPLYNYSLHEGMVAIIGENCDVWLLTISAPFYSLRRNAFQDPNLPVDTLVFLAWNITENGVNATPVISIPNANFGRNSFLYFNTDPWYRNGVSVSPDRKMIALGTGEGALLCKFSAGSGEVYEGIHLPANGRERCYTTCFSSDNTKLYTALDQTMQYDISLYDSGRIMSSEYRVHSGKSLGLKLYKDIIYVASAPRSLHRINRPDLTGAACDFELNAIVLPSSVSFIYGLPTEIVMYNANVQYETSVNQETICTSKEHGYLSKVISAPSGFSIYHWDNGAIDMERHIDSPGTYWVKYRNNACMIYTDTFYVTEVDLNFTLGEEKRMLFCDDSLSPLELMVNLPYDDADYRWQDGSSGNTYQVTEPGRYWVEVRKSSCIHSDTLILEVLNGLQLSDTGICKDDPVNLVLHTPDVPFGTTIQWSTGDSISSISIKDTGLYWVKIMNSICTLIDSAHIEMIDCACYTRTPNAFSPNGDGHNDFFLPIIEYDCPVNRYGLNIYNRFGQRVFHSVDPSRGWNGLYNGYPSDVGTYFYELHFTGGVKQKQYYFRGDVSLIR